MYRVLRKLAGAAVVAAMICFGGGLFVGGQGPAQPGMGQPGPSRSTTLCVIVQVTKHNISPKEIVETITDGMTKLKFKSSSVQATPLKSETVQDLQRIISRLEINPTKSGEANKPIVSQRAADPPTYEIDLNVLDEKTKKRRPAILDRLVLTMKVGEKDKEKEIERELKSPRNLTVALDSDPLVATALDGVYQVRLKSDEVPARYKAYYRTKLSDPLQEVGGPWPAAIKYYFITVRDFEGDHQTLLQYIKRDEALAKQRVINPFDDVELGSDVAMVFAALGAGLRRPGSTFGTNTWTPVVEPLQGDLSDRVWMLFPIDPKDVEKHVKDLTMLETGGEVSEKIRKENPKWAKDNQKIILDDNMGPTWIELPITKDRFTRDFEFKDVRAMASKYPNAHRLIVYERDLDQPGGPGRAQAQEHPQSGKRVFVVDQAIREWPDGIKTAAAKNDGKDMGKDKDKGK